MEQLLEVKGLCKNYKKFQLKEVTFDLPAGYIAGFVGRNGAGKTTTLNAIAALLRTDGGEVRLCGKTYKEDPVLYKDRIGYIGDESYFPAEMTAKEIRHILKVHYDTFKVEEFDALMKRWRLPMNQKVREFSRGMRVKLMFAQALCRRTRLLILDEATNGLDPIVRNEILNVLQGYIEDGTKSILFSTHVLSDLEQIADYIYFIDQGELVLNEAKDELLEKYLLIKGDMSDLGDEMQKKLVGLEKGEYGFEAIIEADDMAGFGSSFVYDKPNIDKIIWHFALERDGGKAHQFEGVL